MISKHHRRLFASNHQLPQPVMYRLHPGLWSWQSWEKAFAVTFTSKSPSWVPLFVLSKNNKQLWNQVSRKYSLHETSTDTIKEIYHTTGPLLTPWASMDSIDHEAANTLHGQLSVLSGISDFHLRQGNWCKAATIERLRVFNFTLARSMRNATEKEPNMKTCLHSWLSLCCGGPKLRKPFHSPWPSCHEKEDFKHLILSIYYKLEMTLWFFSSKEHLHQGSTVQILPSRFHDLHCKPKSLICSKRGPSNWVSWIVRMVGESRRRDLSPKVWSVDGSFLAMSPTCQAFSLTTLRNFEKTLVSPVTEVCMWHCKDLESDSAQLWVGCAKGSPAGQKQQDMKKSRSLPEKKWKKQ